MSRSLVDVPSSYPGDRKASWPSSSKDYDVVSSQVEKADGGRNVV
jgi:hypothetical protein